MKKIIVECKPDEVLVRTLGMDKKEVAHQPNKGEVCNFLKKYDTSLALIDEDPNSGQPKYLNEFNIVEDRYDIKKMVHKTENKTILILKPRLEEWVLKRCKESMVKPETHFLPSNNKEFKDVINNNLIKFENLLIDLLNRRDNGLLYIKTHF